MAFLFSDNDNISRAYNAASKYKDYGMDFASDGSTSSLDRENIKKLNKQRTFADYRDFNTTAQKDTNDAADKQLERDKNIGDYTGRLRDRIAGNDLARKMADRSQETSLKSWATDGEKAADRQLTSSENARNRDLESFNSRVNATTNNANSIDSNQTNDRIAKLNQQTQLADQKSAIERAAIAARATVSSAILGSNNNYGGYW